MTCRNVRCRVLSEAFNMAYVSSPNLPERPVSLAIADGRISSGAQTALNKLGVRLLKLLPHRSLYDAVSGHPDMQLHHIGGSRIVYAPQTDPSVLNTLAGLGFELIQGQSELSDSYPADIAYNVARIGGKYFHNLKYTDPVIRQQLERQGIEPVDVAQGYTKCSVLPVDANSMITSDAGIAKAAERKGMEVLLLDAGSVSLPGLNHGLIGGIGGLTGGNICVVNGSLDRLDCAAKLTEFLSAKKIAIKELTDGPMTDIGSILPLLLSDASPAKG